MKLGDPLDGGKLNGRLLIHNKEGENVSNISTHLCLGKR